MIVAGFENVIAPKRFSAAKVASLSDEDSSGCALARYNGAVNTLALARDIQSKDRKAAPTHYLQSRHQTTLPFRLPISARYMCLRRPIATAFIVPFVCLLPFKSPDIAIQLVKEFSLFVLPSQILSILVFVLNPLLSSQVIRDSHAIPPQLS